MENAQAPSSQIVWGLREGQFDLEADFQGDLELRHLAVRDSTALPNDFEPVHVMNGLGCFGDCGLGCVGKTRRRGPDQFNHFVCSWHLGCLLEQMILFSSILQ